MTTKCGKNKNLDVLSTFGRLLRSITVQMHRNFEFFFFLSDMSVMVTSHMGLSSCIIFRLYNPPQV